MATEFQIDGNDFETLEEFYEAIDRGLDLNEWWGKNLDALDDIFRGGFGTPDDGFTLRWINSQQSKTKLDYPETVRQLKSRLEQCHPESRAYVQQELELAQSGKGPTIFDVLVEIIKDHGKGGGQANSNVTLILD